MIDKELSELKNDIPEYNIDEYKNEIIDKFVERIREMVEINNTCNMIDINIVAQELKEEVIE